jgi:hypothetical protein
LYAEPTIQFRTNDGSVMNVPKLVLKKCPRLFSPVSAVRPYPLLVGVSVAHILIHFLSTGIYESLQPKGITLKQKLASEFSTTIEVYKLAQDNRIHALVDRAKCELERLGKQLSCTTITDLVREEYPRGTDDMWIIKFLKSNLESELRNPGKSLNFDSSNNERQARSINSILITCLGELICDHFVLKPRPSQTQDGATEESASQVGSHDLGCSRPTREAEISEIPDTRDIGGVIELSRSDSPSSMTPEPDLSGVTDIAPTSEFGSDPEVNTSGGTKTKKKKKDKKKVRVGPIPGPEVSAASPDWEVLRF